ncbi:uncharacterized protein K452DRAFT_275327 [Aplosporella prunicola CBS 121167]|uniref:Cytochrome P450 n=1 Tax=Aplosporella prunicola CBS 121167 TaxID=1176127 RepID=A0A6A6B5S5_9PEZI|nr:uncharacterized protein K452DRAFT_275327 [Aplosporella prunicola CBS 121167]KAF2139216.1 hypothetical protein K452DRAFT_275327 [Aplosporella prunicola CBS 121167]
MANPSPLSLEGLKAALETDPITAAISAAGLGLIFHLTVLRNIELDNHIYTFIFSSILAVVAVAFAYIAVANFAVPAALARVALVTTGFNIGLFFSIAVYRLFFHRLRKFPGPWGAKLTRFYAVRLAAKETQYHEEIRKMHAQYGDFIRTGPREVCVVRKSAVPLIYGPQTECTKATWYIQASSDCTKVSIHMTRDFLDHKRRRKAWDRGFAIKALNTYEPRIKRIADELMNQIHSHISDGRPMDATAWSMYMSFDIMGEIGFGKDFGCVASGEEHIAIKGLHDHMNILGIMSNMPWALNVLARVPGATAGYADLFGWCSSQVHVKKKEWNAEQYPQDVMSWLIKALKEKDITAPPSEDALEEDARTFVIAGSETTATTLACILFYLAKYPSVLKKLQAQLDTAMPAGNSEWTYEKAKSVSFIDDIMNETLRIKPAVMTGVYRETPTHGLMVDETFIPGNTHVFVPMKLIQNDPRYWQQADEFIPERFGERRAEMGTDGAPFMPFNIGTYSCPGKNLAIMSLRISISNIAQLYNVSFAPGETGEAFDTGALDTFTTTLPPVMLQFTRRQ